MEINKLESTILNVARQTLLEFNSYAADGLLDEALIRYHEISALTMLGKLQDNGLSREVEKELERLDCEVNRNLSNIKVINRTTTKEPTATIKSSKLVPSFEHTYRLPGDSGEDII